jgi:protein-disulfide isomerase
MSNRELIRERRLKRQRQQRMIVIMVVAGIALIAVAIIMLPNLLRNLETVGDFTQPELNPRPMANDNTMGDPDAPVVIEQFSDFACGHCADFAMGSGELIAQDYVATGQVYFISRSAGDLLNNPNTQLAAEAAYCAADQGQYWEFHDIVYANQSTLFYGGVTYIDNYLKAFAKALDLDMDQFNDCLDGHEHRSRMLADGNQARVNGISSTPSFMINGQMYRGNLPYDQFQAIIEGALAQADVE